MAGARDTAGFVGRAEELEALEEALSAARSGRPVAVLVGGDAGVGKSRLVEHAAARALDEGFRVLFGHCLKVGDGELPYAPIIGALRALAADVDADELARVLGPGRAELARLVPDLADHAGPAPAAGSELAQARLFELLLGALGRLAQDRPLVLVVEDLQWADRSTRELLAFSVHSVSRERLAVIGTYRTDELHRRHPLRSFLVDLERHPRVRRIAVEPFARAEFAEHVAVILGDEPAHDVLERLYDRSEGNPFFTEELVATSGEAGELPDSLREALLVRLERLSDEAQGVVRLAAAAGRRVDHRLLAAVAELPEPQLVETLREAVAAQMLVVSPRERAYEFRHALLREAAYDELLPGEREALHVALAGALQAQPELSGAGATLSAELAYHWNAAQRPELALPASIAAAEEAERVYAFAEAQLHFERALELGRRLPADARPGWDEVRLMRRAAAAANAAGEHERAVELTRWTMALVDERADPVLAGALHERLGRYLFEAGRGEEARPAFARAVTLLPPESSAERAAALAGEGHMLVLSAYPAEGGALLEEAIEMARVVGARGVEAAALASYVAVTSFDSDGADVAVARSREAVRVATEIGALNEVARAYVNASEMLDNAGRVREALEFATEGLEVLRRIGLERTWGAFVRGEIAWRLTKLGDYAAAETAVEEAMRVSPTGLPLLSLYDSIALLALRRGDVQPVRAILARSRPVAMQGGGMWHGPTAAVAAELQLWTGDESRALRIVEDALALTNDAELVLYSAPLYALGARAIVDRAQRAALGRERGGDAEARDALVALAARFEANLPPVAPAELTEPLAYRAQLDGELARLDGVDAPARWARARECWERLEFPFQAAYCGWREAEAHLGPGGDRAAAAQVLRDARATAERLGARLLLDELEALARRSRIDVSAVEDDRRARAEPSVADRIGLTPRELEVVGLLAEGRTNRQIAERLFITEKTASVHVSRILAKLGASNRNEAAAIARRLGLQTQTSPA